MLARTIFQTLTLVIFCTLMRAYMVYEYLPQATWSEHLSDCQPMDYMYFEKKNKPLLF